MVILFAQQNKKVKVSESAVHNQGQVNVVVVMYCLVSWWFTVSKKNIGSFTSCAIIVHLIEELFTKDLDTNNALLVAKKE